MKSLSCVQLLVTPWTAASQAPPSMGFSRQEYWSRVPLPSKDLEENKTGRCSKSPWGDNRDWVVKESLVEKMTIQLRFK